MQEIEEMEQKWSEQMETRSHMWFAGLETNMLMSFPS